MGAMTSVPDRTDRTQVELALKWLYLRPRWAVFCVCVCENIRKQGFSGLETRSTS